MSKERELLKEIMSYFDKGDITIRTFENSSDVAETLHAAQELLAQPEQEPVGVVETLGGYPDESYHVVKLTCGHRDLKHGDFLYSSPPKREPLSEDEIFNVWPPSKKVPCLSSFTAGVKFAEKAHGIG